MTDTRQQLAEHLRFFGELGVNGVSSDAKWRTAATPAVPDLQPPTSDLRPPTSDLQPPTSDLRPPTSDLQPPTSDLGPPTSDLRPPTSDLRPPTSDLRPPTSDLHIARSAAEILAAVKTEIGPDCSRCKLHALGRQQVVFGVGNPDADLMFVGEAPGGDEDIQGIPFVGRAGQLLTKMIEAINLRRDDVYIANVIKCRPPDNRNPEPDEIERCEPFLFQQIEAVRPKVIVALGAFAAKTLLRSEDSISRLRGRVYDFRGARLIPTFHPSFLLRSPDRKRDAWEDLKKARALLAGPVVPRE